MNGQSFWDRVREEVDRQHTSFEWLYAKTGIAKGTLASWKSRGTLPRADEAYRIAEALDVTVEFLLTGHARRAFPLKNATVIGEIFDRLVDFDPIDLAAVDAATGALLRRYAA